MKHPLPWHHATIAAVEQHLRAQERHLADVQGSVERVRAYLASYRTQVCEAERRGMDGFDADRLLVKRRRG